MTNNKTYFMAAMKATNHYKYLEKVLVPFLERVGFPDAKYCKGLITAHGDKCYSYRSEFEKAGIPFEHGVAVYLLTYLNPWAKEIRETESGWVHPLDWILKNYPIKFKHILGELDMETFDKVGNLLLNMSGGLKPKDLSKEEVQLLEQHYGPHWFENLGYDDALYERPKHEQS